MRVHGRLHRWRQSPRQLSALGLLVLGLVAMFLYFRFAMNRPEAVWRRLAQASGPDPLNIIVVTVDTLRADRLSCYGAEQVQTPHLDAFAREGVRFTAAATTVPFTLPAHCSIMTGTYPPTHGVRENVGYFLDERRPTLAELLAAQGYATAAFVSAFVLDARWGIARGFEHYFDDFALADIEKGNLGSVQRDGAETVTEAVDWLDRREAAEPFFLWMHLFDPHDPYTPPEPYRSRYPGRPYDAEVAYTDALLGKFRAALAERGLLERSLIILTGDHGEGLGDHGELFHGFFVYDSTVHVPLIIRPPFDDLAGRSVTSPVSHVDLLPTVLAATGAPIPAGSQGVSLIPLMLGRPAEPDRGVYSESFYPLLHYGWSPLTALRRGSHKLIDVPQPELYDLTADAGESTNLVLHQRRLFHDMRERLREMLRQMEARGSPSAGVPELDEETLASLRALGYVAGKGGVDPRERQRPRSDPKEKIALHRLIMTAQSDIGGGDEAAAEQRLRDVLGLDPGIVDAHQMLANIVARAGRFEEAAAHFKDALRHDSNHQPSLFGLSHAYLALGRPDDALQGFQRLLKLHPGETKASLAAARIYLDREELPLARRTLVAALQRDRAPAILHHQLGEVLALEGRTEAAVEQFQLALAQRPEMAQAHFNLAVIWEELGQVERAVHAYEQTVEHAPKHYQAQFNLGRLFGALGRNERQLELYEAALASNPDFIRGYYFLAKLLMDRGLALDRAETLTREGLKRDPDLDAGPLGYFLLADILNRQGRRAEAQQALNQGHNAQARAADKP